MKLYKNRRQAMKCKLPLILLMVLALTLMVPGCGKKTQDVNQQSDSYQQTESNQQSVTGEQTGSDSDSETGQPAEAAQQLDERAPAQTTAIPEDGSYTTKDDVALYLHTYGKLPQNFITKKQAKKLGWTGGSLEDFAPGKCIGGDYFGNYEGLLPEDKEYHECDIGTLGKKKRGVKRIIYSDDGYIYYTGDHYETFELLYEP